MRDPRGILLCDRLGLTINHRTRDVPAALNIEFGVRYRITGIGADRALPIRRVWRLPAPGFLPPGKPAIGILERFDRPRADQTVHATYGFDDDWEVIPGEWVLEFWHGQDKLGEQRFHVVRPTS